MKKNKFGILLSTFVLGSLLLVGCSDSNNAPKDVEKVDDEKVAVEDKVEDKVNVESDETATKEEAVPQTTEELLAMYDEATQKQILETYSKENYDYSLHVDSQEKLDFYKTNEIFSGEEKTQAEDTYFIYYYSPECVYCKEFYPTIVEYSKKENAYPIYKINIDILDNYTAFVDSKIDGTPTLKLYNKKDDKFTSDLVGVQSLESLPVILK